MDRIIVIIPTRELVSTITDMIGEFNIPEVDLSQLAKVILVGSLSFNDTNWSRLDEVTYGALKVLTKETEYMSLDGCGLYGIPELHKGLVNLSQKLYRTLINLEVDRYNTDPDNDLPHMVLVDVTKYGDMVIEVYQKEIVL